jgi:hypothetical protein
MDYRRRAHTATKKHLYNKNKDGAWRVYVCLEEVRTTGVDKSNNKDEVVVEEEGVEEEECVDIVGGG